MSRATGPEQHFLFRLLIGELRQGALEGLMVEAVAKASGMPVERVRRAAMHAGRYRNVARAAIEKGEAGLASYNVELFRPVQPMLAQTAEDADEAHRGTGRSRARIQDGRRPRAGAPIGR